LSDRRNAAGERTGLAVADGESEDFAVAVGGDPGGDHDGLGDHPPVHPRLAVGRIQEHVGEWLSGQRPVGERRDLGVEVGADPRHLRLGDPGVRAECLDQVVDLPRRHPVQVGLHHHREQRLIHPPAAFQQRREERPGAQLGDPQLQIPGGGGQGPGPVPVALRGPGVGAFVRAGADHRRDLGVDQRLVERLGRLPDPVVDLGGLECVEHLE
jgi:hypothetical protein